MVADMVADMMVEKVADKVSYMVAYYKNKTIKDGGVSPLTI